MEAFLEKVAALGRIPEPKLGQVSRMTNLTQTPPDLTEIEA